MNTQTYWKTITPSLASEWLRTNSRNRPVKDHHVRYLAGEMTAGRWQENGETIKKNGDKLLDGQHRLLACVRAGVPFRSLVVEGLNDSVFMSIDGGVGRSGSDTLSVMGEKNTKRLAAALSIVESYFTGTMGPKRKKFSNLQIEDLLLKHPGIRASVNLQLVSSKLAPPATMAAFHYLFSQKDKAMADEFIEKVLKGHNMTPGDPACAMRERLIRNSLDKAKLEPDYIAALLIKAWNATRGGQQIKSLSFRDRGEQREAFPLIA